MKSKSKIFLSLLIVFISYFIGFIISNYSLITHNNNIGIYNLEYSSLENLSSDENGLVSDNLANITYEFSENPKYIYKFAFDYNINTFTDWSLNINYYDSYGNIASKTITGVMADSINTFSEKIAANVYSMTLKINNKDKISVSNFQINNKLNFISTLSITFVIISLCGIIIYFFRKSIQNHVEYLFLIIALFGGCLQISLHPLDLGISYDDQIHFENTYSIFNNYYTKAAIEVKNHDYGYFNTKEEIADYFNKLNIDGKEKTNIESNIPFNFTKIIYLPQAIGFKLASLVLPFSIAFIFGKIIGLLFYCTLVFFAIKKAPKYKLLLTTLGLIPTALFLATAYSYDPPITAFTLLGLAYWLYEMGNKGKLSTKNCLIIILSFVFASFPKAIYIPIILLLLLFPNNKFKNKKSEVIFKISIIGILLLIMSTFVLPTLTTNIGGDSRGGNTSVTEQLKLIIKSPVTFTKTFIKNAGFMFFEKLFGVGTLINFAYGGHLISNNIYYLFLILLFFTSIIKPENKENDIISTRKRFFILLIVLAIISMIWGALYLSYTPVGSSTINGVQGRYFIPLIFPLILVVSQNKFKYDISKNNFTVIYSILLMLITFVPIIECLLY